MDTKKFQRAKEIDGELAKLYESLDNLKNANELTFSFSAVISRRDEGLPTADAVEVVVELRRYRELNINKLKNYKKD